MRALPVTEHYRAFARVEPIAILPMRAAAAGVVSKLRVLPGSQVRPGETLATLDGPQIESLLANRRGALRSARAQLAAVRRALDIERRQLAGHLSTVQSVAAAQSAVAAATASFQGAQARLRTAERARALRAPSAGTVIAVRAANGEQVSEGETLLTLQPDGSLWLDAQYYGVEARAIHVGMTGRFEPASGGTVIPVRVATVSAGLAPDGGESVGLLAIDGHSHGVTARWISGEWGSVTLDGATRRMIAVPTRALILDRARWWVLVRGAGGDRPRAVIPGPTRGWNTFIESGLRPGQQVVVENAWLEFHRGIARRYRPPD